MARNAPHLGADDRVDRRRALPVDQVTDVLLRRETDHDAEAVARCDVEQRAGRHGVRDPHRVDPVAGHLSEVALDYVQVVVLVLPIVGSERAVRHASHVEARKACAKACAKELATHPDSRGDIVGFGVRLRKHRGRRSAEQRQEMSPFGGLSCGVAGPHARALSSNRRAEGMVERSL